jgi:hypothetical protein
MIRRRQAAGDGKTDPASIASAVAPKCAPYYEELVAQMKCLRMSTPNSQMEFITACINLFVCLFAQMLQR